MSTASNVNLIKLLSVRYKFDADDAIEYVKTSSKKGRPKKEIEVEQAKDLFDKILEDAGEPPLEKDPALYKKFEKAPDKVDKPAEKEAKKLEKEKKAAEKAAEKEKKAAEKEAKKQEKEKKASEKEAKKQEKEKKAAEKEAKKEVKPVVKATPKEKPVEAKKINQYIVTFHQPDGTQIIDMDYSIDKPVDFIENVENDICITPITFLEDKYLNKYADLVGKKSTEIDNDEQASLCFVETTEVTNEFYDVVYEKKSYIVKFHNILNILPAKPVNPQVSISNHVSNDESSDESSDEESDDEEEIKPQDKELVVIKHTPLEQLVIDEFSDDELDEDVNKIVQSVMMAKMAKKETVESEDDEESDDEEEEEEEEVVKVKRVKINDKDYLKSSNNVLYDVDTNDAIGVWDENKQEIILNELDEDSYVEDDDNDDESDDDDEDEE